MKNRLIQTVLYCLFSLPLWTATSLAGNHELQPDPKPSPETAKYHLNLENTGLILSTLPDIRKWLNDDLHTWLKLGTKDTLKLVSPVRRAGDYRFYRITQTHNGLPVVGLETVLVTWHNRPVVITGANTALTNLHVRPVISLSKAMKNSRLDTSKQFTTRTVYLYKHSSDTRLSYEITGAFTTDNGSRFQKLFVDAVTGTILSRQTLEHGARKRYILDLKSACRAAGINRPVKFKTMIKLYYYMMKKNKFIARTENSAPANIEGVDRFHRLLGDAYTFLKTTYNMDSLNNRGLRLVGFARVHYNRRGKGPQCVGNAFNATWIGPLNALFVPENAMDYVEIVAHELAHGIISNGSKLKYKGQSGALNEAIADAIGVSFRAWQNAGGSQNNPVKHFRSNQNIWKLRSPRRILRNLANPKSASPRYPDHFDDYVYTNRDHGGVHTNSNIINQAFYILSVGGNHPRLRTGPVVKGIGIRKASQIYALAGSNILTPHATFRDARYAFALAARTLFGKNSREWVSVHKSMDAVGVEGHWRMPATQSHPERRPEPRTAPAPVPRSTPAPQAPSRTAPAPTRSVPAPAPARTRTVPSPQKKKTVKHTGRSEKKKTVTPTSKTPKWVWFSLIGLGFVFALFILFKMRPRYDDTPRLQIDPSASVDNNSEQTPVTHGKNTLGTLVAMDQSEAIPLDIALLNSPEGMIIGRAPELVHVVMESNDVSRRHIRIRNSAGQLYIEDMNSSYGSQVDGCSLEPFVPVRLGNRQIIRIAGHSYQVVLMD